jgi:aspartyl/asparaginyl-tRNA synthetase
MDKTQNRLIEKLRQFFADKMEMEQVHVQHDTTILAACEDPYTVVPITLGSDCWPLPQTGQMRLEEWLLLHPEANGYFCATTSYRNEPSATFIEGRHKRVFPLFEFELHGGIDTLIQTEKEMLEYLGFKSKPVILRYEEACRCYGVDQIEAKEEGLLHEDFGPIVFLIHFPERSHPFWNMKRMDGGNLFAKVDVILYGQETIGSAERSCDVVEMRDMFEKIPGYADKLYQEFGKDRVDAEMDEYLKHNFIERCGGGIGVSRLLRAMKLEGLM